jgi:dTDP-4-amino-4,6-dideoxygalactose transaminase
MDHRAQYLSLKADIDDAIRRVIESGEYIVSEDVFAFEREFADYCGASHGVSVRSGHDAILVALLALGIGSGDEVITPDNGCPSIPLAISHTGARPVYADIDEKTLNLDPAKVEPLITPRTKAILGVHSYGQPCAIKPLKQLAEDHGAIMIEDCSLATGARVDGQRVGNLGHIGVFSLSKGKILNSYGNGAGMILTDDASVAERATMYARYGFRPLQEGDGLKYEFKRGGWVCAVEGYNSHMDSLQAAVLRIKLRKMDQWIEQRNERARQYDHLLARLAVILPYIADNVVSAYRGYTIRVKNRYQVWDGLRERGIDAKVMFLPPTHLQPVWRRLGYREGDFPVTEMVAKEMLSLPIYPEMTSEQVREVVTALEECVPPR